MAGLVPGGPEANPKSGFPIVLSLLACGPRGCRLVSRGRCRAPRHHIHARGRTRVEHEPPALLRTGTWKPSQGSAESPWPELYTWPQFQTRLGK